MTTEPASLRQKLFNTKGDGEYRQVLRKAQDYISKSLSNVSVDDLDEVQMKEIIVKYITDFRVKCSLTSDVTELANYIYHDMSGYSFISREKIFEMEGFEELNINSWDKITLQVKGKKLDTDHRFLDELHANNVIERMLRKTGTVFDNAMPRATAEIQNGVRICTLKPPITDKECGVCASIRKVTIIAHNQGSLVETCTLTEDMLELLNLCLMCGASMCISGETGSGKTTLAGGLLNRMADYKRIITIEEAAREWNFIKRDGDGKIINDIVHLKTRPSDDPKLNITQEDLVKDALRLDPDIISPSEIRGQEAFEVIGAANTGHTIITTVHSNSARDTPTRIINLAKKAFDMSDHTLLSMAVKAFPILVHLVKLPDGTRKVREIVETLGYNNGIVDYQTLYEFQVTDNIYDDNDVCIHTEGHFTKVHGISENLAQTLLFKGARRSQIEKFT